jgi:hypothetical protein
VHLPVWSCQVCLRRCRKYRRSRGSRRPASWPVTSSTPFKPYARSIVEAAPDCSCGRRRLAVREEADGGGKQTTRNCWRRSGRAPFGSSVRLGRLRWPVGSRRVETPVGPGRGGGWLPAGLSVDAFRRRGEGYCNIFNTTPSRRFGPTTSRGSQVQLRGVVAVCMRVCDLCVDGS